LLFMAVLPLAAAHAQTAVADANARKPLYYRDPMHPSYTSDKPGKAPDCGMDLVPVYADDAGASSRPGTIQLTAQQQKLMGIRLARVENSTGRRTIRTIGRVAVDETRVFPLIAGAEGWVTQIFASTTDSTVRRGQPLAAVYGRDYTAAERAYIYALRTAASQSAVSQADPQDTPAANIKEARLTLENMGFGEEQIEQLARSHQVILNVTLQSPADGIIIKRNVFPKQKFDRGAELFRIADLKHVWIVADLFGDDAAQVHSGATARISIPGRPMSGMRATVSESLAPYDEASRTLKLRLEADNPKLVLRPDMVVDVEISTSLRPGLVVPAGAIVSSGAGKTVFVQRGDGSFEARPVVTGWQTAAEVEVTHGLREGETVVASGNFLLDSERRIGQGASRQQ